MDVVPDKGLLDFLDGLGKGEDGEKEVDTSQVSTFAKEKEEEKETDVWSDIVDALDNWTQRVIDAESRHNTSGNFQQQIEDSIRRQQLDGFLTSHDVAELRYITDIWIKLLNTISSYSIDCEFVKRDIITLLLELYTLRQINSCLFIETCLKL